MIYHSHYHGWNQCLILANERVEVVIVPAIGRIMQFRFRGEETGPFWENRALDGGLADPAAPEWSNFGGDKAWPAPQADWPEVTPRGWPPPAAFDALPVEAVVDQEDGIITLESPLDPYYGIQVERQISLKPGSTELEILTRFKKVQGNPVTVAVWVVTQLKHPQAIFVPVPEPSLYSEGFNLQTETPPPDLRRERPWLVLGRDPTDSHKIGSDGGDLLWVGEDWMVRVESPREPGLPYPDQGSSVEVYTNPDPLAYIELETLGPLRILKVGESIERVNRYTLLKRSQVDPDAEAKKVLGGAEGPD